MRVLAESGSSAASARHGGSPGGARPDAWDERGDAAPPGGPGGEDQLAAAAADAAGSRQRGEKLSAGQKLLRIFRPHAWRSAQKQERDGSGGGGSAGGDGGADSDIDDGGPFAARLGSRSASVSAACCRSSSLVSAASSGGSGVGGLPASASGRRALFGRAWGGGGGRGGPACSEFAIEGSAEEALASLTARQLPGSFTLKLSGGSFTVERSGGSAMLPDTLRVILCHGGAFCTAADGAPGSVYRGGGQRLMLLRKSSTLEELKEQVAVALSSHDQGERASHCRLKYSLPGSGRSLMFDLETDQDLFCMLEELGDAFVCHQRHSVPKLQLYVEQIQPPAQEPRTPQLAQPPRTPPSGAAAAGPGAAARAARPSSTCSGGSGDGGHSSGGSGSGRGSGGSGRGGGHSSGGSRRGSGGLAAQSSASLPPTPGAGSAQGAVAAGQAGSSGYLLRDQSDPALGSNCNTASDAAASSSRNLILESQHPFNSGPVHLQPPAAAARASGPGRGGGGGEGSRSSSGGRGSKASASSIEEQHAELRAQLDEYVSDLRVRVEVIRPWELQVHQLIGAGAFGEVHLARWRGTEVACKCLSPAFMLSDVMDDLMSTEAVADLMREADILARLRHPNIVAVFGVVLPEPWLGEGGATSEDRASMARAASSGSPGVLRSPALVCEYLAAGSLRCAINKGAEWLSSPAATVKLMLDTARGLEYLHSKSIVHFDLKSANVLIGLRGRTPYATLCDFGLAKRRSHTYVSGVNSLRGTLPWIAPEILKSPDTVDEKSDIYSFGVVMWEVWTQQEPFRDLPLHALLHQLTQPAGLRPPLPGDDGWDSGSGGDNDSGEDAARCSDGGGLVGGAGPVFGGGRRRGRGGGGCGCGGRPEPAPGWEELIRACWQPEASARPSAAQLVQALDEMLRKTRGDRARGHRQRCD